MRNADLQGMTVDQLVRRFVAIALEQDEAELRSDAGALKSLYWLMDAVREELKTRDGDQRRALVPLYDHPNVQVRLKAAKSTLAIAPQAARSVLAVIANSRQFPQAGEAGMSLWNLEQGIFRPT